MRIIISAASNIPTVDKVIFIVYNACYGVNLFLAPLRRYNKAPFGACGFDNLREQLETDGHF